MSRGNPVTAFMCAWGAWILRGLVAFAGFYVTFGYLKGKITWQRIGAKPLETPVSWRFLAGHSGAMLLFAAFSARLFGGNYSTGATDALAAGWLACGTLAIAFAALAFLPAKLCIEVMRSTGNLWIFALAAAAGACLLGYWGRLLWEPTMRTTFDLVRWLLRPFLSSVVSNPATMAIGSAGFTVEIAPECSGYEGVCLMLVFGTGWLWMFRRECRFPRALLLLPAGVAAVWLLNAVRIAALILIGSSGAPVIAAGGFHSQAGWIAFTMAALGFIFAAQRLPWVMVRAPEASSVQNPTAAYLMPFLASLAAAMIARAFSEGCERLYPLRFFAAAAVLWFFRKKYTAGRSEPRPLGSDLTQLDWRFGWVAAVAGVAGFAVWLAMERPAPYAHLDNGIDSGLKALPQSARIIWLVIRTLAAVVTVPIAEELAFRGFMLRRLMSPDFESVGFREFGWFALLISSVAFGLMHGDRWVAGTVAGVLYALALRWRGRIGDAVVAHATTNALLAVWVLARGDWYLW